MAKLTEAIKVNAGQRLACSATLSKVAKSVKGRPRLALVADGAA